MGFATYSQSLQKGKISEILQDKLDRNQDPIYARVLPLNADGVVTLPLTIMWWLRGEMGQLEVDTEVYFATVEDGSGIIFARADGEWKGWVPGDVTVEKGNVVLTEGNFTMDKGSATLTDGDMTMTKGNMTMTQGDFTQNGNQTVNGNDTVTGDQKVSGNQDVTGNSKVTGAIECATSITATAEVNAASVKSSGEVSAGSVTSNGTVKAGSVESSGTITATGALTAQAVTSESTVNAASVTATGTVSGADVQSSNANLNSVNTSGQSTDQELKAFKSEYAAHKHTTTALGMPTSTPI